MLDKKLHLQFYRQAGDWYREQGDKISAVSHYRKAGANGKILQVIMQWTFPCSEELALCYLEAIQSMPPSFVGKHPLLRIIHSFMLCTLYRYSEALRHTADFCLEYDRGSETPQDILPVLGEAYLLRAHAASCLFLIDETCACLKQAQELLPNGSILVKTNQNIYADSPIITPTEPEAGSLERNLEYHQKFEALTEKVMRGGNTGKGALAAAEMCFYTRDLEQAEYYASQSIVLSKRKEQHDITCSAYFLLMRCNLAKGNYERTMESLDMLKQVAKRASHENFFSMPDLAESWLALKLGHRHAVARWIVDDKLYWQTVKPWNYGRDRVIRCYYLLENQCYRDALTFAEASIVMQKKRGQTILWLHLEMMKAVAYYHIDRLDDMALSLEEVYRWTYPNNMLMLPVEYGGQIRPVFEAYRKTGRLVIPEAWLEEIGKKAKSYYVYQNNVRKRYNQQHSTDAPLVEALSKTERKYLLMVTEGLGIQQIAEQQYKSISSVKATLSNVYRKIGANGMADAVRIATSLNIQKYVRM